jgi:hypothetical protein
MTMIYYNWISISCRCEVITTRRRRRRRRKRRRKRREGGGLWEKQIRHLCVLIGTA